MSDLTLTNNESRAISTLNSSYRISRDGYTFNTNSNVWILNKETKISFQPDVLAIKPKTLKGFKRTLARYAEEYSVGHTSNMYLRFQRMIRDTGSKEVNDNVIRNWRGMLNDENEWYLGSLRSFLISWYDYGYSGITQSVVDVLEGMRLKGSVKGVAIANRCPLYGGFSQNEQLAIASELVRLFAEDLISFDCYSYLSTLQATARRAIQLRQLKAQDIIKEQSEGENTSNYYLNVPRAKQQGVGFRQAFKRVAITEELYLTLLNLSKAQQKKLSKAYGLKLGPLQKTLTPLFVDWSITQQIFSSSKEPIKLDDLLKTDLLHSSTIQLRDNFMRAVNIHHEAISERTGDRIYLSARRFRRTRGTNLGRKGISAAVIAEALDHSDTQNVMVYTENTADTVTYIDQAVGKQLAPFARAFKGEIICNSTDGERGDDPTAKIPNKDNDVVGACGTNDFCVKGYESCYVCEKFRPLLDAPHEKFLESLYKEKEARLKTTKSEEYASTKDTLILAVEWVVQTCAEMNKNQTGRNQ